MSDRVRALFLIAAACCAGCAVNQDKEVALYRQELDRHAAAVEAPAPGGALTLADAMQLANRHNETLALNGETYLQSLIDKERAFSGFLPTVSASGSYNAQHTSNDGVSRWTHITSASLRGSISLIDLTNWSEVSRAAATAEERRQLLLDVQETVLLSVAQTYYSVLRAERSVAVLKDSLVLRAEQVRDIQARAALGMSRPLDLAQAQSELSRARVAELQALSDVRNARATLAFLIGVPAVDGPLPDQFVAPEENRSDVELEAQAKEYREDFLAAHFGVVAASHSVDTAVRRWFPSLSLSLNDLLLSHPDVGVSYGLGLSALVPIFSAGLIHADVRSAWSRYRQSVLSETQLSRQIHEQISIAAENLRASRDQVAELKIEVDAAQRAVDLADAQYRLGSATNLDRLVAQNSLLNAQLQLTSEEYNVKVFYLDLLREMGQFGLETPGGLPPIPGPAEQAPSPPEAAPRG